MSLDESSHHKHTQRGVPIQIVTFWGGLHSGIVSASNGQFFRGSMRVFATLIVTRSSVEEHLQNLENILKRLQEFCTGSKRAKCLFMSEKMEYLEHDNDS